MDTQKNIRKLVPSDERQLSPDPWRKDQLEERINRIAGAFLDEISAKYNESSAVRHTNPILPSYLRQLRTAGVKVALDTGVQ